MRFWAAGRVRTDLRWKTGVEDGGGRLEATLGRGARLTTTSPLDVKPHVGAMHDTKAGRRKVAAGGASRSSCGGPQDRENPERRVSVIEFSLIF
jgi:hypothetical protein